MNVDINKIKTIAELEEFRTMINEECDARKQVLTIVGKAMDISKQDFGYLKESFENIVVPSVGLISSTHSFIPTAADRRACRASPERTGNEV